MDCAALNACGLMAVSPSPGGNVPGVGLVWTVGTGVDWNTGAGGYEGAGFGWTVGGEDTWELDDAGCVVGPGPEEDCARAALAAAFAAFFSILFLSFSSFFLIFSASRLAFSISLSTFLSSLLISR